MWGNKCLLVAAHIKPGAGVLGYPVSAPKTWAEGVSMIGANVYGT